jgi:hypothetical protein
MLALGAYSLTIAIGIAVGVPSIQKIKTLKSTR